MSVWIYVLLVLSFTYAVTLSLVTSQTHNLPHKISTLPVICHHLPVHPLHLLSHLQYSNFSLMASCIPSCHLFFATIYLYFPSANIINSLSLLELLSSELHLILPHKRGLLNVELRIPIASRWNLVDIATVQVSQSREFGASSVRLRGTGEGGGQRRRVSWAREGEKYVLEGRRKCVREKDTRWRREGKGRRGMENK